MIRINKMVDFQALAQFLLYWRTPWGNIVMRYLGFTTFTAAAALLAGISCAQASALYDLPLQNSDFFNGSGNTTADGNSHWSLDEEADGVELGLTVVQRYTGFYTPDAGTSTYHVPTGATPVSNKSGTVWGFDFSINTGTQNTLDTTITSLCMTDVLKGTSQCFDPLNTSIIDDNTINGDNTLAQNSEALSFLNIKTAFGDSGYDINADDTYIFTLNLSDNQGASLGSVSATVITGNGAPTPEPATMALFGASLAGMGWLKRKRRKANV